MGLWGSSDDRKDTAFYYDAASEQRKAQDAAHRSRKLNLIFFAVIIVLFLGRSLLSPTTKIEAATDNEAFCLVTAENEAITFYLTDVESVELGNDLSTFDRGTLQSGTEDSNYYSGTYVNDALGEYQLHVNLNVPCYVTVHYTGGILVFNSTSADNTNELYTNLLNAVNS